VTAAELEALPLMLKVPEFAQLARKGKNWGYEQVRLGKVRAVRLGHTVRIPRDAALAFLEVDQGEGGGGRAP